MSVVVDVALEADAEEDDVLGRSLCFVCCNGEAQGLEEEHERFQR